MRFRFCTGPRASSFLSGHASLFFQRRAATLFAKSGLPHLIRPILGGAEIIAALLFLVPPTRTIGGYALLVIFALAALIHILHGQPDVGALVIYAAAVYTVLAAHKS